MYTYMYIYIYIYIYIRLRPISLLRLSPTKTKIACLTRIIPTKIAPH